MKTQQRTIEVREKILKFCARGWKSNKQIAEHCKLTPRTSANHISALLGELKLDSEYRYTRGPNGLPVGCFWYRRR